MKIVNGFKMVGSASFLALLLAYLAEIFGKLNPCMLCIYQRLPYILICCFSLLALCFSSRQRLFRIIITIFLLTEIGLALYHVGVEHYIFEESYVCQFQTTMSNSFVITKIANNCSNVNFKFMNLSMAEWNVIYAIIILIYFINLERKNGFFTRRSE